MEKNIAEIAQRIKGLREILDIPPEEMAGLNGLSPKEYLHLESGEEDFSFTFLLKCSQRFGVDIVELLTGSNPKLSFYTVVRKGFGLPLTRREGFSYRHLAYLFKGKLTEPFLVTAPYREEEQSAPIPYSTHAGQEFDYVLSGTLKVDFEGHVETLHEGDSAYYDSGHPHGMIAVGGQECVFLAVVIKGDETSKH
jgi:mannose-6-phosphate isomerase-like protein (cupin superfamily)